MIMKMDEIIRKDITCTESSPFYQTSISMQSALWPSQTSFAMDAVKGQIHKLLFYYHEV